MKVSPFGDAPTKIRKEQAERAWFRIHDQLGSGSLPLADFTYNALHAVAGAAARLGRDPLELAEWLSDGRVADLVLAAEIGATIEFPATTPAQVADQELEDVLCWVESEERRIESQLKRIRGEFDALKATLHGAERQRRLWRQEWRSFAAEEQTRMKDAEVDTE